MKIKIPRSTSDVENYEVVEREVDNPPGTHPKTSTIYIIFDRRAGRYLDRLFHDRSLAETTCARMNEEDEYTPAKPD